MALFDFILQILNGRPQEDFFERKSIEAKSNRANRERKRLARKRSRAAARERKRECEKLKLPSDVKGNPTGQTRSCSVCEKRFASRKRLSRHKCPGAKLLTDVGQCKPTPEVRASPAQRSRRARARKAKKEAAKAAKVVVTQTVAENKLPTQPPVTASSAGVVHSREPCEDCGDPSVGLRLYQYPKCLECGRWRSCFDYYPEFEHLR